MTTELAPCPNECSPKEGSPGCVADNESVVALVFTSDVSDGIIMPTIFPAKRLKSAELSVGRPSHTSLQTILSAVVDARTKTSGECLGGISASVGEIRREVLLDEVSHVQDEVRLYCVNDDPDLENDYVGHAVIAFSEFTKPHGRGNFWKRNNVTAVIGNLMLMFRSEQGAVQLGSLFPSNDNSEEPGTEGDQ